jgi:hypothetical protein
MASVHQTRSKSRVVQTGPAHQQHKDTHSQEQKLSDAASHMLEEARMVLPGLQALFGFQLIATFNERFTDLDDFHRGVHVVATILVAIAVALIMTPAAYHRIGERRRITQHFIDFGSRLISSAMLPLALAISMEVYLVCFLAMDAETIGMLVGVVLLAAFAVLWLVIPMRRRMQREHSESRD